VLAQRVRGRHRNTALAAWRRTRAVELATQGLTYQQIADELGYANRGTVHRIVQQALESRLTEGLEHSSDRGGPAECAADGSLGIGDGRRRLRGERLCEDRSGAQSAPGAVCGASAEDQQIHG
jgi:transposase-like protein